LVVSARWRPPRPASPTRTTGRPTSSPTRRSARTRRASTGTATAWS